jgi:hypothetical protein
MLMHQSPNTQTQEDAPQHHITTLKVTIISTLRTTLKIINIDTQNNRKHTFSISAECRAIYCYAGCRYDR